MGGSKKNRRKNPADDSGVDLLSLAFNLPTRRDIERADREAAQHQIHTQRIKVQYNPGEDESSDAESSTAFRADASKLGNQDADETPKAQKSSKRRHQHQVKDQKGTLQAPSPKDSLKKVDQELLPTRRASKRASSKPPKARERSSSSPAIIRVSSPASSIPSSATFPRTTSNYSHKAANLATSDASTRPPQPSISRGVHPQQYYQPMFAFPTVSVYPPSQYYSAVAKNDLVSDCNQYVPLSMYSHLPPPANTHKSQQPTLVSQEIQHIQSKLDEVVVKLSKCPDDATLKSELSTLQTELNTRLNSLLGMETPKESIVPDASEPHNSKTMSSKLTNSQSQHAVTQREKSPERKIRHHLCTGCGKVRSSNYHSLHPMIPGGRPSMNYCEDCFEENVENGILKHHFCYGCGTARSKEFHQNHTISKGDRSFPNYCSICVEGIRSAEALADASVVDFAPSRSHESNACSNTARDRAQNNKPVESLKSRQELNNQGNQPNVLLFSTHTDNDKHNKFDSHAQRKIPQPLKISTSGLQLSPSNSSPDSPYYPVRNTGASQRRAERSPLASPGSQYCGSPDTPTTPRYQSPYVEDVISPIQEANQRLGDYQHSSKSSPCGRGGGISPPITSGRQKSHDERLRHSTKAPNSDISQEVTDDSTEGHASTDDSAQSTGSKTVKFRPKVDIRLSDSRISSHASSHAKILEEDIKPDDDTIPSRVGIYGTSPVKSQNGYYARAQGFHNASSLAGQDGYDEVIPERSYRGAFSKDSPASSWQPPPSNIRGEHWYSRPNAYYSTTSPSMDSFAEFRPGGQSTFNYGSGGGIGSEDGLPSLRTTRSAFIPAGPGAAPPAFAGISGERGSQKPPLSPTSSSRAQSFPDFPNDRWKSYTSPYVGGQNAESSFRKGSPWNNFPSRFDSECHTMQDDSSFTQSVFSDYSQPSSNPYYEPRKRPFPDLNDCCSFSARAPRIPGKWAKEYQSTTRIPKRTPYWIPEPIIEEPDSPVSSPGKRAKMLEFNDINISPESANNVATELSLDSEGDDDSDKENTLSKSSLDTPSLD
ncbi:hypothetical protein V8C37DRAFT_417185 [Trichoderma ceciliae]